MLENYELYQERLKSSGTKSKDKMIDNKVKTFQNALERSYNSESVSIRGRAFKSLITGIPTNPLISRKNFSTLKEHGCEVGDELFWEGDQSHWIITTHDETERAIFQGYIEKALYEIKWIDPKTSRIYSARACAKGPDETSISGGVKHSIFFDNRTDSLYLIVSDKVKGSKLLQRYEYIMVNGLKWRVEVADRMTKRNLIFLQLIEEPFDRDHDTEDMVGGKKNIDLEILSALDYISEFEIGTSIDINPKLYRGGQLIDTDGYHLSSNMNHVDDTKVYFNRIGQDVIKVSYLDYEFEKTWEIEVVERSEQGGVQAVNIHGDSRLQTFTQVSFNVELINVEPDQGSVEWGFDTKFFTMESSDKDGLVLKVKNTTGNTKITYRYSIDGEIKEVSQHVNVVPLFGGR